MPKPHKPRNERGHICNAIDNAWVFFWVVASGGDLRFSCGFESAWLTSAITQELLSQARITDILGNIRTKTERIYKNKQSNNAANLAVIYATFYIFRTD